MRVSPLLFALLFLLSCGPSHRSGQKVQLLLDWKAQMEHAGFFVAQKKGYYKREGLSVEILDGNGAPNSARLVGNGTYNLGVSSGSATVMARAKDIPVISLAVINQHSPVVVYSLKSRHILKPEDLVGKRIGVNIGGTKHREFQAFLKKVGIPESSIHLVGMSEANPAPLMAGKVDAMLGYTEDEPVTVELHGDPVNRIAFSDYGIDLYSTNIITNEAFLKKNTDLVRRFMKASLQGWQYAVEHPNEAVADYMASRPETDRTFNEADFHQLLPLLQSPAVQKMGLGAQTAARWKHTRDVLLDLGMIDRAVPIDSLFTNEFLPSRKE